MVAGLSAQSRTLLAANPPSTSALPAAVSDVARTLGAGSAQVEQVAAAARRSADALVTASSIDPATLATLSSGSTDVAAIARAQSEIGSAFKISGAQALTRLLALSTPSTKADLTLVMPYQQALVHALTVCPLRGQ